MLAQWNADDGMQMKLQSLRIANFTAFEDVDLSFSQGLNVFVGENGTGKTHLLKLPYSVLRACASEGSAARQPPTKDRLRRRIADKLVGVLRPETLGRLVRRVGRGRRRCEVELAVRRGRRGAVDSIGFNFASQSKSEVVVDQCPEKWLKPLPVYLPTRELLSIYPGFAAFYDNHHTEFDETWRDTCQLLGSLAIKGPRSERAGNLLAPLEQAMGGRLLFDGPSDRFYLEVNGTGRTEMPLVAEGVRKLGMLARLTAVGALLDRGCLFWDQPETNLDPKLIRSIAKALLDVCREGVQVFVATHSLFLLREMEVLGWTTHKDVPQRYFALEGTHHGVVVDQGTEVADVAPLVLLDEDLKQSDRYLSAGDGSCSSRSGPHSSYQPLKPHAARS